jgi:hypothetical protein
MHYDVLDEPGTVRGDADRLTTAPPVRGVHDGPPYSGDQRDGRQFYQSFLLERELDALGDALAEPQRVDQLLIWDPLARVACTALVELVEERYSLRLHLFATASWWSPSVTWKGCAGQPAQNVQVLPACIPRSGMASRQDSLIGWQALSVNSWAAYPPPGLLQFGEACLVLLPG